MRYHHHISDTQLLMNILDLVEPYITISVYIVLVGFADNEFLTACYEMVRNKSSHQNNCNLITCFFFAF